jgi:hypothetical protein
MAVLTFCQRGPRPNRRSRTASPHLMTDRPANCTLYTALHHLSQQCVVHHWLQGALISHVWLRPSRSVRPLRAL